MIKTHGLNQVSLSLADLQRSLAFYEQLFGVREYQRGEDPAAR
jgi:catechol 2,3-dioxygenase-like lactoylglutathione lyase family enzyme